MSSIVNWITSSLSGVIAPGWIVFIISMCPLLELRGGLLAASLFKMNMWQSIGICLIGNIIPIPFILLLITKIFDWLRQTKTFRPMVERLETKAMSKKDQIEKYEFWGLVAFVGIPLPGTGAWTGALIAALLGIKLRKSIPAILLGICCATVIMSILSFGILGKIW